MYINVFRKAALILILTATFQGIAQNKPTELSKTTFLRTAAAIEWNNFRESSRGPNVTCKEDLLKKLRVLPSTPFRLAHRDQLLTNIKRLFDKINEANRQNGFDPYYNPPVRPGGPNPDFEVPDELKENKIIRFLTSSGAKNANEFIENYRTNGGNRNDQLNRKARRDLAEIYRLYLALSGPQLEVNYPPIPFQGCTLERTVQVELISLSAYRTDWRYRLKAYLNCGCSEGSAGTDLDRALVYMDIPVTMNVDDLNTNNARFYLPRGTTARPVLRIQSIKCCGNSDKKGVLPEKGKVKKVGSKWTTPSGTTRIAAVGTVRDEKVMMTSRGSIGGIVTVQSQDGETIGEVTPDEDGHFIIDFATFYLETLPSKLTISSVDVNGNPLTSTTVDYLPGRPETAPAIPVFVNPEVPFVEKGGFAELAGSNFGVDAEVILTDANGEAFTQDVVSSSTNHIQYFVDAPVGPTEIVVENAYGESLPMEINVYEFGVAAGKTNLIKNEQTYVAASYNGLPEGTKIIFTNLSDIVTVKPKGQGQTSGNETTFIVNDYQGEVSLKLKAKRAGGWALEYRLEFPE